MKGEKEMNNEKKELTFKIRLSNTDMLLLTQLANKQNMNKSEFIRYLILKEANKHETNSRI